MNILLDYLFPVTSVTPTPAASTSFLKQALVVANPKDGGVTPGVIVSCASKSAAAALVGAGAAAEIDQLFDAGMSKVLVLPSASLDLDTYLEGVGVDTHTILISYADFTDANVTGADFGDFEGVIGVASTDDTFLAVQAAILNRAAFHTTSGNKAKNMFYAFGKLLSNQSNWINQQYVSMPLADDVATLGDANGLFDDKISFVISDDEFGKRLALFACGGEAIVAPYVKRNLQIDMQSKALSYISGNQPSYTKTAAALLEDELQKVVASYIERGWIEEGTVSVDLVEDNFVANGTINIAEPKALWRVFAEMRSTL